MREKPHADLLVQQPLLGFREAGHREGEGAEVHERFGLGALSSFQVARAMRKLAPRFLRVRIEAKGEG